ncbi:hypothetical protein H8356DRAFT_949107 [Neocallimastix lanati (nom. inval.)]|uniref:Uncharacterized protein n=1 Tax=Neocallimastix californiae TaxID=1754190 RepID=A0A1Y2CDH2_9FUNG|nr:hypothetical protein H8356DRAFT_949107 [Neocallimastix sp. JGI-2020a]ORY44966.1 hypothetical protein LY90DRAFT_509523 [Neocallimastix californiae]|eukprot:ORY44966.1 hypothetical protein LY90DRAFT_509523 [Neocallimastix californiae]
MILDQEDINIYLKDKNTKEFYDEYNKENPDIRKLLFLSKNNKICLHEPLNLEYFLLIDISLYCNQKFDVNNINQFNRYIDIINYFYKLLSFMKKNKSVNNIINEINNYDINKNDYSLNNKLLITNETINFIKSDCYSDNNYLNTNLVCKNLKLIFSLTIINDFILKNINNNNDLMCKIYANINDYIDPFRSPFILYIYNYMNIDLYTYISNNIEECLDDIIINLLNTNYIYKSNVDFDIFNNNKFKELIINIFNKNNIYNYESLKNHEYNFKNELHLLPLLQIRNLHDLYMILKIIDLKDDYFDQLKNQILQ